MMKKYEIKKLENLTFKSFIHEHFALRWNSREFCRKLIDEFFHPFVRCMFSFEDSFSQQYRRLQGLRVNPDPSIDASCQFKRRLLREQVEKVAFLVEQFSHQIYTAGKHEPVLELS